MQRSERLKTWWRREAGAAEVLALALPLMISTSSWTLMHFIDRVFLLWYAPAALAAALPSSMVGFTVMCFFLGLAAYVNTFVAQYHGARRPERIGPSVWQGIWLGLASAPLVLLTAPLAPWIFDLIGHAPAVREMEVVYYQINTLGAGAMVVAQAASCFFTGRGQVRTVMVVDSAAAGLNVVLDYVWIFGALGFPALGIAGAAWATVAAQVAKMFVYLGLMLLPEFRAAYHTLSGWRPDRELMGRLLRFGCPSGMHWLIDVGGFTAFVLLVGRLGEAELAATSLAFNINALAFVPIWGVGIAVTTLVGQRLGEDRPQLAARGTWTAYALSTAYMVVISLAYFLVPHWFMAAHAVNANPAEFESLRQTTALLLKFVAAYCVFDTMNIIFISALRGAGDTRFVMYTMLAMACVLISVTAVGIESFGLSLLWAWSVITVWICILGVMFLTRFLGGAWTRMRVIEPEFDVASVTLAPQPIDQRFDEEDPAGVPLGTGDPA